MQKLLKWKINPPHSSPLFQRMGIILFMIGIDIVKIERMQKMIDRFGSKALERFLCDSERNLVNSTATAAGFWALKEAASKALGCGIGAEFGFQDVRIRKSEKNAPLIALSRSAIERFGIQRAEASITHDGGFAVAVVVIETKQEMPLEEF